MTLRLEDKKTIVAELTDVATSSVAAVVAEYRGLSVSQMTELRSKARQSDVYIRVVRNTLAKRAFENTDFACLSDDLTGPVVLMFSREEPSAAARLTRDFAKKHEQLQVQALAVSGEHFGPDRLESVASLPSRDEAIAQLMSVIQAPITKLVRTIAEPTAMLARTMGAIRDSKQAS